MTTQFPSIVNLNVGGRHFTTALSTLRSEPDSQLAAMFSGKQEVARDQDGRYFIDADSYAFGTILDFLRSGEIIMGGMSLESYKLAEKLGIKSFVEKASSCKAVIAAEYNTTIKSWYPDYEQLLNKVIEDIKIKLSKANGDSINFQLEAKEEQRILPGELLFYVSSAAEDPHCFFLFKILEIDLTERGFFGMNSAWQQSADGQRWRGSLSFRVKKLLEPF